jgi:hypothetical protein
MDEGGDAGGGRARQGEGGTRRRQGKGGESRGWAKMEIDWGREGRHLFLEGALQLKFPHSLLCLEETFPHFLPRPGL